MDQHFTIQRVCTWAAPACTFVFFLGFAIAGYLVPPDPHSSSEETRRSTPTTPIPSGPAWC